MREEPDVPEDLQDHDVDESAWIDKDRLLGVRVTARLQSSDSWSVRLDVQPGDVVDMRIEIRNNQPRILGAVVVGNNLPKYVSFVPGSTLISVGENGERSPSDQGDRLTGGGFQMGNLAPYEKAEVTFKLRIDAATAFEKLGTYDLRDVGVVRPEGHNEHFNTAALLVKVER